MKIERGKSTHTKKLSHNNKGFNKFFSLSWLSFEKSNFPTHHTNNQIMSELSIHNHMWLQIYNRLFKKPLFFLLKNHRKENHWYFFDIDNWKPRKNQTISHRTMNMLPMFVFRHIDWQLLFVCASNHSNSICVRLLKQKKTQMCIDAWMPQLLCKSIFIHSLSLGESLDVIPMISKYQFFSFHFFSSVRVHACNHYLTTSKLYIL